MKLPITEIQVSDRMRKDLGDISGLANSMQQFGLIQPIVVDQNKNLIAGGRRYSAAQLLKWTEIEIVYRETLSATEARMVELEENVKRKEMTWQERCLTVAEVHRLHAQSAALNGDQWMQTQTGDLLGMAEGTVSYSLLVAKYLKANDKDVVGATGFYDAIKVLLRRKEDEANSRVVRAIKSTPVISVTEDGQSAMVFHHSLQVIHGDKAPGGPMMKVGDKWYTLNEGAKVAEEYRKNKDIAPPSNESKAPETIPLSQMLLQGDCIQLMNILPEKSFDHILTDIPYGIDVENMEQEVAKIADTQTIKEEHDVEQNVAMMPEFLKAAFRVTKDNAFCVFWYDLEWHKLLYDSAIAAGWRVQRWPLVWIKTHTCLNTCSQYNWTKTTENAMVCRKPAAVLVEPQGKSYFACSNDAVKKQLGHPFAKPIELWKWVLKGITYPGQTVLDPYAGRGSALLAMIENGIIPFGMELQENHYNHLMVHVQEKYKALLGTNTMFT